MGVKIALVRRRGAAPVRIVPAMHLRAAIARRRPLIAASTLVTAVVFLVAGSIAPRFLAERVRVIVPFDASAIEVNRGLHVPGEDVAAIYGQPMGEPIAVMFPHPSLLYRPPEDPGMVLMREPTGEGFMMLQAKTWLLGVRVGSAAMALLAVLMWFLLPRPQGAGGPESGAGPDDAGPRG